MSVYDPKRTCRAQPDPVSNLQAGLAPRKQYHNSSHPGRRVTERSGRLFPDDRYHMGAAVSDVIKQGSEVTATLDGKRTVTSDLFLRLTGRVGLCVIGLYPTRHKTTPATSLGGEHWTSPIPHYIWLRFSTERVHLRGAVGWPHPRLFHPRRWSGCPSWPSPPRLGVVRPCR